MNKAERIIDTLRMPLVTEKTALLGAANQYAFEVAAGATKADIKAAVEQMFEVTVEHVNVVNIHGKAKSFRFRRGVRQARRKAYVRLAEGQTIDVMARA